MTAGEFVIAAILSVILLLITNHTITAVEHNRPIRQEYFWSALMLTLSFYSVWFFFAKRGMGILITGFMIGLGWVFLIFGILIFHANRNAKHATGRHSNSLLQMAWAVGLLYAALSIIGILGVFKEIL